jgi:hypothetical protein
MGLYVLYSIREPRMFSQMFALSPGVTDVAGNVRLIHLASSEPIVLLALLALPLLILRTWPRWRLIVIFAATSFALAALADLQAGGNVNYYYESLFAIVPIAVLGMLRASRLARRHVAVGLFLVGLFAIHFLAPSVEALRRVATGATVDDRNDVFRRLEPPLRGRRIFRHAASLRPSGPPACPR